MPNDRRTLLDIASGGQYKTSKDLPPLSELLNTMAEYQEKEMSKEVGFGVTRGNLFDIAMVGAGSVGVGGGIVKTASTARRLFQGWASNLRAYMGTLSKKQLRRMNTQENIINDAIGAIQKYGDDVKGTQGVLSSINKKLGLGGKVVVPEIKGAAGGAMKQATKKRGAPIPKKERVLKSPTRVSHEKRIAKEKHARELKRKARGEFRGSRSKQGAKGSIY
tara:strand:+ start:79 stop:738 length:660 start_codon:yes stop_codon:yes gene_type:complete